MIHSSKRTANEWQILQAAAAPAPRRHKKSTQPGSKFNTATQED